MEDTRRKFVQKWLELCENCTELSRTVKKPIGTASTSDFTLEVPALGL